MTQARTWSEELVAQYYEIQGFKVERNLGYGTGRGGGRREADVVAYKTNKDKVPTVIDIEVGAYYESATNIASRLKKRYTPDRRKAIRDFVSRTLFPESKPSIEAVRPRKVFIHVGEFPRVRPKMENELDKLGIEYKELWEIFVDIPAKVEEWGERFKSKKGSLATLPECYTHVKVAYECYYAVYDHVEG